MTERQINQRSRWWMRRLTALGVAHYEATFTVVDEPDSDEDAWATIHISDAYDSFDIEFARSILEKGADEIDAIIVHELCHVPVHRIMRAARRVDAQLSLDVKMLWERELHDAMERTVEQFARAIIAESSR